jgi:hypothetical protein
MDEVDFVPNRVDFAPIIGAKYPRAPNSPNSRPTKRPTTNPAASSTVREGRAAKGASEALLGGGASSGGLSYTNLLPKGVGVASDLEGFNPFCGRYSRPSIQYTNSRTPKAAREEEEEKEDTIRLLIAKVLALEARILALEAEKAFKPKEPTPKNTPKHTA